MLFIRLSLALLIFIACPASLFSQVQRELFQSGGDYLIVEFLDDDLVHFELSAIGPPPPLTEPLYSTPMVAKTDYAGSAQYWKAGNTMETGDIRVVVDPATLAATVTDITKTPALVLSTFSPWNISQAWKGIEFTPESFTHIYGLGQIFYTYNSADGDWVGRKRYCGPYGNVMSSWDNGATGNTQVPVAYMVGQGKQSYAIFMDNKYRQEWDFQTNPYTAQMYGDWLRWYVMTGDDLQDLRRDYMELTGRPPVPPKKAFGLWVSEYGYDEWAEMDDKLATLVVNEFPVDGFVLDLQWFGGIQPNIYTQMGSLSWDLVNFPDPAGKMADLESTSGIGIMVIEESYIGQALNEHAQMAARGYLAEDYWGDPIFLTSNPWWGMGGYIDWTCEEGADFWHDWKREPLIQDGVMGHWTDLGEPEMYDGNAYYDGIKGDHKPLDRHADIHNLYNLLWNRSIWEGYLRNGRLERPWILSRSGTAGSQRYGVNMWSGDIAGNLSSLTTHMNAQMHLSMSGIDYYGSDIGGFHRQPMGQSELDDMYTQWFANGCLFDIPLRPHVNNLDGTKETAPDRIGDLEANRANLRQRYSLIPYLYSLAYRAHLAGDPVFPPPVYLFQADPNVREMGSHKMIGPHLLMRVVSYPFASSTVVYLPAGTWINFNSGTWHESNGEFIAVSCKPNNRFQLPLFARSGAIIPRMSVDSQTGNALGFRRDGSVLDDLIVYVMPGESATEFTLYEDDGTTTAYLSGEYRETLLSQSGSDMPVKVRIEAAAGSYNGAPLVRDNVIELAYAGEMPYQAVLLNGSMLDRHISQAAFDAAQSGWYGRGDGIVLAKSGLMSVEERKNFVFAGSLNADRHQIPAAAGGTVEFTLAAGTGNTNRSYIIAGSRSGTEPGTPLPGGLATIPLNRDAFTDFVLDRLNTNLFADFSGTLDSSGNAVARFNAPAKPELAGTTLYFAYALKKPWDFASNPVAIEIIP